MADDKQILPAAEFQSLPLEFIISAPLAGAVKAQAVVAQNMKDFIMAFKDTNVEFTAATFTNGSEQKVNVKVPLLSMVPVPHLRIDSLTIDFKYEVSQIVGDKKSFEAGVDLSAGTTGLLSKFVNATLKGSVTSRSSSESTVNRSGHLAVTVHASEAPIPEGLARVLSLLAHAVPEPAAHTLPAAPPVNQPVPIITNTPEA
jgi:Protein of unknown function (DUF2589)